MMLTSLICTLGFAAFILYFVITNPLSSPCYENVKVGVYILSIMYPIETILFFICLTGSIALSKYSCWKIFWIILFGPVLTGISFGELGLVYICLLLDQYPNINIP
jgi:hypothetical protein